MKEKIFCRVMNCLERKTHNGLCDEHQNPEPPRFTPEQMKQFAKQFLEDFGEALKNLADK